MSTSQLAALIGKQIRIMDARTQEFYRATIWDAKTTYGKLRIQVVSDGAWFEPTAAELKSAQ